MAPKPFFESEFRQIYSSFSSDDNTDSKVKQRVLGIYCKPDDDGPTSMCKMPRIRLGEAMFVPIEGLVGHGEFWHMSEEAINDADLDEPFGERAVLLQSIQNYRKIALEGKFKHFPENDLDAMQDPRFGEQVIVDMDDNDICIGDVYEVTGDSTLKLRVACPRKASRYLDLKNRTGVGNNGIAHYTTSTAMSGWFCEVLCEGTMAEGSELILIERPEPKWTLVELAKALYGGEGDAETYFQVKPSWGRSQEELEHLLSLPYLGECGWKAKMRKLQRVDNEKKVPVPYFTGDSLNNKAVGSVLGVYGRDAGDVDEYMPRSQVTDATFVPIQGIEGHEFYHMYTEEEEAKTMKKKERSVLLQSIQNYRQIMKESQFPHFPSNDAGVLYDPCFGEQIILDIPIDICLGDVFCVAGSTLTLRVTSPRKPCGEVDGRNNVPYGSKGLRHYTCSTGLAGWFCEVLTEGKLVKGSEFELVERPYPQWTLRELSKAIYGGEGDAKALLRGKGSWGRPMEELHELLANPVLAEWEWKDELREVLERIEIRKAKNAKAKPIPNTRRRRAIPSFETAGSSACIPLLFAFVVATISTSMVMAVEDLEEYDIFCSDDKQ